MKIKIDKKNLLKIRDILAEVNGRAEAFAVISVFEIEEFAKTAEQQLSALPKAERVGAVAKCLPAGPTANSYKYVAASTEITIQRFASGWFLIGASKSQVWPKSAEKVAVSITADQAAEIQRRSIAAFNIA